MKKMNVALFIIYYSHGCVSSCTFGLLSTTPPPTLRILRIIGAWIKTSRLTQQKVDLSYFYSMNNLFKARVRSFVWQRNTIPIFLLQFYWAGALVQWSKLAVLLGKSTYNFQRNKEFLPRSLVKIYCCAEHPWQRGSVLGLLSPGLEFRILCLEGTVISFISPSSRGFPGQI